MNKPDDWDEMTEEEQDEWIEEQATQEYKREPENYGSDR